MNKYANKEISTDKKYNNKEICIDKSIIIKK